MSDFKTIEFKHTNNIFVNAGIIALHRFLDKHVYEFPDRYNVIRNELHKDKLIIESDNIFQLLEDVYYYMGKEVYDTATDKQLEEAKNFKGNVYYKVDEDKFYPFPKMNTYGLTQLFTNNAQGVTRKKENTVKFEKLKEINPELAKKIETFYKEKGLELKKKIYFNEPYTKITQIEIKPEYFEPGENICPILNEGYKKLVEGKNISPFISGIPNFNSLLASSERKVSLKALYLIRFSPALVFYHYTWNRENLVCHFFNSNTLQNIDKLCDPILYKSRVELQREGYYTNFRFYSFTYPRRDGEYTMDTSKDAVFSSELTMLLLYTFYKRKFEAEIVDETTEDQQDDEIFDPFYNHPLEKIPISVVYLEAKSFSKTMRPEEYDELSNIKYIFRLFYFLEHVRKIHFKDIWQGLKFKDSRSSGKDKKPERELRQKVFYNLLYGKSILPLMEKLFYDSLNYKLKEKDTGFRKYDKLADFTFSYENTLKRHNMDKSLQKKAINLGKSIGQGIINYEGNDPVTNIKASRKYLIGLHKSRNLQQFLDSLYRIANKYGISVSNDILENIDGKNFMLIRQFALISALNQLNMKLYSSSSREEVAENSTN